MQHLRGSSPAGPSYEAPAAQKTRQSLKTYRPGMGEAQHRAIGGTRKGRAMAAPRVDRRLTAVLVADVVGSRTCSWTAQGRRNKRGRTKPPPWR
jgi:hypothetical protein